MNDSTKVRFAIAKLDTLLANESAAIKSGWSELVELLAMGPEPQLRTCPNCGGIGMAAAKICGVCWAKLTPVEPS